MTIDQEPIHLELDVNRFTLAELAALTDRGALVMTHHPQRLEAVATDWDQRFGSTLIARLSDALTEAANGLPGPQPDHLIESVP